MSEFPCTVCGSKKRFHKKGCSVSDPHGDHPCFSTQEVIRAPGDLPQVGDWYVVSFRNTVDLDAAADKQIHVLDVIVAPCLSVETHGRDYRVTFDMERTKQFVAHFPGQLYSKTVDVAKVLHGLAESLEGVK